MSPRSGAANIDEYIAEFPEDTQAVLQQVRQTIHDAAPSAVETISYSIPTFDLNGRHVVHFAGYPKHIGFYPTGQGAEQFREEFAGYKTGKGSVQFPLSEPMPLDLIRRITLARVATIEAGGR